jgi:SAM-dependent methyltransferase
MIGLANEADGRDEANGAPARGDAHRQDLLDPMWRAIGRQLRCPSGLAGAMIGRALTHLNKTPYRLAVDALGVQPKDRVLELGFGPGAGLAALVERANEGRVFGIDLSSSMVAMALRANFAAVASGRLIIEQGPFSPVAASDNAFDKVLLVNTVYFVDREGHDMREVYRLLGPGGRVVAYATDRTSMDSWPFSGPDTHRTFSRDELRDLFVAAGFAPERVNVRAVDLTAKIHGLIAVSEK